MGRAGQLRKPKLDKAHGELNAALHRLHLQAGQPSLTDIARALHGAGISRSTIHDAFCSRRLPKWKVVDALVEVLSSQAPGGRPEDDQAVLYKVWMRAAQDLESEQRAAPDVQTDAAFLVGVMQRMLLPGHLPKVAGVELAARYRPSSERFRGGGDWYDAVVLPENKVVLMVGDVMGASVLSAALMGQMRSALRVLVDLGLPPHEVLNRLDEQALRLSGDQLATCLCAVYDIAARTLALATAGHLPPYLLNSDGLSCYLDMPTGTPIGLGAGACETVVCDVPPGSMLFLYTDGLVESRTQKADDGRAQMSTCLTKAVSTAGASPPSLDSLCDAVLSMTGLDDSRRGDVALLGARFI